MQTTTRSTEGEEALIPNRHVYFYDNLILNPSGVQSKWQQFQIDGRIDPAPSSGVPSPSLADDDLRIAGNVIWNGCVTGRTPADRHRSRFIWDDTRVTGGPPGAR